MGRLKKRKTRKEKVLTDLHRKISSSQTSTQILREALQDFTKSSSSPAQDTTTIDYSKYPYLIKDLRATGVITGAIILIQLILFLSLKFHVINLPGISY